MLKALVLSYADRLAAFTMPLLMLRGVSGDEAYVRIEYVIAISVIVATFADAGLRNYILFHFGRNRDAAQITLLTGQAAVFLFLTQLLLLVFTYLASQRLFTPVSANADLWLGVLRGVALSIIGVATQIFIVHDRPLIGILLSLASWLIGAIALLLPNETPVDTRVTVFFLASFLILFAVPVLLWRTSGLKPSADGLAHLQGAISWGWPLLIAAGASIAVANFTRVYGISAYSITVASALVFWMRIFSIIQLSHRAAITIVSRAIFASDHSESVLTPHVLRTYLVLVLPAAALALTMALGAPQANKLLGLQVPILSPGVVIMIGLQVLVWSFAALLELPLTRQGRTFSVLLAGAVPSTLFVVFLATARMPTLQLLTSAMTIASAFQMAILAALNFKRART